MSGRILFSSLVVHLLLIQSVRGSSGNACPSKGIEQKFISSTTTEFYGLAYNLEVTFPGSPRPCFRIFVDHHRQTFKLLFCDKTFSDCMKQAKNFTLKHSKTKGMNYRLYIAEPDVFIFGCHETEIATHEEFFWGTSDPKLYPREWQKREKVEWWYEVNSIDMNNTAWAFPECDFSKVERKKGLKVNWTLFYLIFGVIFLLFAVFVICK